MGNPAPFRLCRCYAALLVPARSRFAALAAFSAATVAARSSGGALAHRALAALRAAADSTIGRARFTDMGPLGLTKERRLAAPAHRPDSLAAFAGSTWSVPESPSP